MSGQSDTICTTHTRETNAHEHSDEVFPLEVEHMPDGVGHQDAQHEDDEQTKQEAEALMVSDEVYHADTLLDVSRMLISLKPSSVSERRH